MMMNYKIGSIGLIAILCLVVAVSGCTNNANDSNGTTSTFQTFSDGIISFNYPIGFEIRTKPENITAEGAGWHDLAYLANKDYADIDIRKNSEENSAAVVRDGTEKAVKDASGQILSTTTETNPNGVVVEKSISQQTDPYTNTLVRYYDMFFSANNTVYYISVYGDIPENQQIKDTTDLIFNTLKIV
jgi:hypothetical protein